MENLLKIGFILSPFFIYILVGKPILTSQAILSILVELIIILLFLSGSWNKRTPDIKASIFFFAYILVMSGWIIGKGLLLDDRISMVTRPLLHVSIFFLFYFALCYILDGTRYNEIAKVIVYPAITLSAICLFQKAGIDMFKYSEEWVNGTLGNPTNSAMYLCACLPFAFIHKRPFIPVIFILAGIMVCSSASALIAALIVIFIYFLVKKKYFLTISLTIFIMAIIFLFKNSLLEFFNSFDKLCVWQRAIMDWKEHYLFGNGLDAFRNLGVIFNNSIYDFTHNHYIWILHSLGLVGLVLFVNWICSLKFIFNSDDIRCYATLSLVAVGVMACVSVPMRVYPIILITAVNLAIITKERA